MSLAKAIGDIFRGPAQASSWGSSYANPAYLYGHQVTDQHVGRMQASATTFTCADLIAKAVANVSFHCDNDHWERAFRDPNIMQSEYDYWYGVAWDAVIFGNSYNLRSKGRTGSKGMLAPLEAPNVLPEGTMMRPSYRMRDETKVYSADEIVHVRYGGGTGLRALGRVAAGWGRIKALEACDREIDTVFRNGLAMSHVLHGGHADETAVKKMTASIRKAFGIGGERRSGVVGLTGGFKIDTVKGVTPADSDLRNLRSDLIREIAALFGIPPFAAGGSSDTKFSNVVARHAQVAKEALLPLATAIAMAFSHQLGARCWFEEEDVLKGDFATLVDLAIKASGGAVLTPNQARKKYLREDPVADGDKLRQRYMADPGGDRRGELPADGSESDR